MHITSISEAKANLSHLIQLVQETGEPIVIGKAGKPVAVLSAFDADKAPRELGGSWEGKVKIAEDCDAPLDEVSESFYTSTLFPDPKWTCCSTPMC